ncbi:hypothetical protein EDC61_109113 [Sulfuritortus calidifontis]|uniref:Uncharacterized protein n=1 Tax=Sulfuritortus calidifontis TaxID=1914471 RepID=A0A4R3JUQ6_9PROT|nr:hypothetical protein [Sulfuritortus calidifontis]TCS71567.1 hypothetical protein EDC61_109113 [Sulfuritortus calidifontis]
MRYYAAKVLLLALVIVAVSAIAKRPSGFAAQIAPLPLTSLLAFVWLSLAGAAPSGFAARPGLCLGIRHIALIRKE